MLSNRSSGTRTSKRLKRGRRASVSYSSISTMSLRPSSCRIGASRRVSRTPRTRVRPDNQAPMMRAAQSAGKPATNYYRDQSTTSQKETPSRGRIAHMKDRTTKRALYSLAKLPQLRTLNRELDTRLSPMPWTTLDDARLAAWVKEEKGWLWIANRLQRSEGAVSQRWRILNGGKKDVKTLLQVAGFQNGTWFFVLLMMLPRKGSFGSGASSIQSGP
ncbi:hypothetical protein F4824DRAFT_244067 [Ustulina deusta]|nr:hypothetical protein F4824DRAFT_244067 [Ustulina deusta]